MGNKRSYYSSKYNVASDFNFVDTYSMVSEMCKVQERYSWSERKAYEFLSPVEPQCWYRLD